MLAVVCGAAMIQVVLIMKIAISIPDPLHKAAERAARRIA